MQTGRKFKEREENGVIFTPRGGSGGGHETIINNSGRGQRSQDTLKFHYIDTWGTDWGQVREVFRSQRESNTEGTSPQGFLGSKYIPHQERGRLV